MPVISAYDIVFEKARKVRCEHHSPASMIRETKLIYSCIYRTENILVKEGTA